MIRRSLILWLAAVAAGHVLAQGNLSPAGAPAPTMKSLQQMEPRVSIAALPFAISQPGSYYLETNVTGSAGLNGITISANDVTLDLMGFVVQGVTNGDNGILISGLRKNIQIANGIVRGWGGDGVDGNAADSSRFTGLRAHGNKGDGIRAGQYVVIESCISTENGGDGFDTFLSSSILSSCASSNGAQGIRLGPQSRATDCIVTDNRSNGIHAVSASTIDSCHVAGNRSHGVFVGSQCIVRNCDIPNSGAAGIIVTGRENRVENNHLTGADTGLRVDGRNNTVINNTVLNNTLNYDLVGSNSYDILLCEIPETIGWPARVRLAGDLVSSAGLVIDSDNVTVDLGGFALIGSGGGSHGINVITPCNNLIFRNGQVRGWALNGIDASDADNSIAESITAFDNGQAGIRVGNGCSLSHCTAKNNGDDGFIGADACAVEHCSSFQNTGMGFNFSMGTAIHDCSARDNSQHGFIIGADSVVHDCTSSINNSNGFFVGTASVVRDNSATDNGIDGIRVQGTRCRVEANHVALNAGSGIRANATDTQNIFMRNTATGNFTDYNIHSNNTIGEIITAVAPEVLTNSNPWANYRF